MHNRPGVFAAVFSLLFSMGLLGLLAPPATAVAVDAPAGPGFGRAGVAAGPGFGAARTGSWAGTAIGPGVGELRGPAAPGATPNPGPTDLLQGDTATTTERVLDYRVDYDVQPDGTVNGRETITYQFPEGAQRRGIFAYWVIRRPVDQTNDRYRLWPMSIENVESPTGAPTQYETFDEGQSFGVRIGDPDTYVSGRQTYVIEYTVQGAFNPFEDHQELYVNPVGFNWQVPIDSATVTVRAPNAPQQVGCWAGHEQTAPAEGSPTTQNCQASGGDTATFTATNLGQGQGMTIAGFYPQGTVSDAEPILRNGDARSGGGVGETMPEPAARGLTIAGYSLAALIPALAALFMGLLVRRRGRDERYAGLTPGVAPADGAEGDVVRGSGGPVAVRFNPPDGATPGLVGVIVDETADTRDVSATVVDLAVRGYLTIEEVETGRRSKSDWELRRTDPAPAEPLLRYEQEVYDGIFARRDVVRLSSLRNHFATTLALAKKSMYREVVDRHWYRRSPERTRSTWAALAMLLAVVGGLVLFVGGVASASVDAVAGLGFGIPSGVALGLGILLAALLVFVLGRRMPARTAQGSAVYAQTLGFKQYLETAEANQIRFEEAQSIFSRYLPYAIVFGCAERWAKVFNEVAESAAAQGYVIDMPTWYVFYGMHGGFVDFGSIAGGMEDFSTVAAGTFTATPGTSGGSAFGGGNSGFGGGFGGGGFSGGGGFGGGGGGSW
ncbi:DUF2207 domain-containing protein [Piscicoccus intestinalis]|uniref:DUF2207 domain-containing protein n=1 Tax=Piscicoccus intestinalis TaxID=746033 RepID=UPI00083937F8|nr:DUF2207 domain-containing protein [Piscicoccus intestinalis]